MAYTPSNQIRARAPVPGLDHQDEVVLGLSGKQQDLPDARDKRAGKDAGPKHAVDSHEDDESGIQLAEAALECGQNQEMDRKPFRGAGMRNAVVLVLSGLYEVGVLLLSLTIWPNQTPTILYGIPVIIVSLKMPPQFVVATALLAIVVDAIGIFFTHPPRTLWGMSFLALIGVGYFARLIALQRRQEARIQAVEPLRQLLTVIIGYTHVLRRRSDLPTGVVVTLERIDTAALRRQYQIDRFLGDSRDTAVRAPSFSGAFNFDFCSLSCTGGLLRVRRFGE